MGYIMSKCKNCNIEVLDKTEYCPLCHSVLLQTEQMENMYPDLRNTLRRKMLFVRIYLFCAILVELVLFMINYRFPAKIWWCAIVGLVLIWIYMTLRYAILGSSDHRIKVVTVTVLGVLVMVGIDVISGYRGWSVEYVIPTMIILLDALILVCMIYNRRNWQSYIMWQLFMILCSILPIGFYISGLENNFYLSWIPFIVSGLLFLGTMIIGDRRAMTEVKRRFHIN